MPNQATARIDKTTFSFLSDLARNNDRDWFNANKHRYLKAKDDVETFVDALIERMRLHDRISTDTGRKSLMRIYNDQRFHKDRPPYNPRFAGSLGRVKPELRGGYFFSFKPGESGIACGFFGPEIADLARIRADIDQDHSIWRKLLDARSVRNHFGELVGDQLKTAPRGFAKDHPAVDLLRRKQFILRHQLSDKEVLSGDLLPAIEDMYKAARPWFDHMSEVLTTDENGVSLLRTRR